MTRLPQNPTHLVRPMFRAGKDQHRLPLLPQQRQEQIPLAVMRRIVERLGHAIRRRRRRRHHDPHRIVHARLHETRQIRRQSGREE